MTTQIWQHNTSGERYAVEVDGDGKVISAAGPLTSAEVEAVRAGEGWDSDAELVDDLNAAAADYRLSE